MELNPGKIFLADQRGATETSAIKHFSTFNFEKYKDEHREPFGNLFIFNDDFIAGGKITFYLAKADSIQLFFPITGGLDIVAKGDEYAVETGQVQVLLMEKGEVLEISNPYPNDTVNYLQIGIQTEAFFFKQKTPFEFDFEKHPNKLIDVIASYKLPFRLSAGRFTGREEVDYKLQDKESQLFAFVIDGAFEIEGRLMHARDGLALWDLETANLEALSNNAIVLLLELTG